MDDFQKAVVDAVGKLVAVTENQIALAKRSDERLEKIVDHWDRAAARNERHEEIEARHIFLREREHSEKFASEIRAEAIRIVNKAAQDQAWMLDVDSRAALRKSLDEIESAEKARQERRAKRDAETANSNTTGTSLPSGGE